MRAALCLSGQPRGLKVAHEYIKRNLLDVWNPDVFVHSWDQSCSAEVREAIVELYRPKAFLTHSYFSRAYFERYTRIASEKHPASNTGHMYASVFYANELKREHELRHGFRYDFVVKSRFDYALNRTLPVTGPRLQNALFSHQPSPVIGLVPGKLFVPNDHSPSKGLLCNDQFAWGTSEVMDRYSATWVEIDYLYDAGCLYNGEQLLSGNLQIHKLTGPNMVYVDMNNPFPAGPYNSGTHALVRENVEEWRRIPAT